MPIVRKTMRTASIGGSPEPSLIEAPGHERGYGEAERHGEADKAKYNRTGWKAISGLSCRSGSAGTIARDPAMTCANGSRDPP